MKIQKTHTIFSSLRSYHFLSWYILPNFLCLYMTMYFFFLQNEIILYVLTYNMLSSVNELHYSMAIYFPLYYTQFCNQISLKVPKMSFTVGFFQR